ncbi:MAG: hypothetical protein CV087_16055 [Candidatus Brocadia sp. WS118]|nr:MAG: hypothetical protein CV087_16055 [Candidatus Brocadia sp. WS118]
MNIYPSGTIIANRYEVVQGPHEKPSLAGGMGLVYLCVDHSEDGHPVALKTFRPEYLPNREARDRFLREGSTWIQLGKHPHIVRCHRVFRSEVGAEVFFVLELIAAFEDKRDASLRCWLTPGKPLPIAQALLFALHIARGMQQVTTEILGLVHRDLKPENVLIGQDGLARITDFGLVQVIEEINKTFIAGSPVEIEMSVLQRTQKMHGIVGTPRYMAPEQWKSEALDARTDIYAFGCILFEMTTGKFAISGNNLAEIKAAQMAGKNCEIPIDLPENLRKLLSQCLRVDRNDRFREWNEVVTNMAEVYARITGKTPPESIDFATDAYAEQLAAGLSYYAIGISYTDIGKFPVARAYFEKVLSVAHAAKERRLESAALGGLGNVATQLGDAHRAIEFYEQYLAIAREIDDRHGEGVALGNLGNVYRRLGDARRAIAFYEQHLSIVRELGDHYGEGAALGNLGTVYELLGDTHRAIAFYKQRLAIARVLGDRYAEGRTLGNLGNAYFQLGDARQSIQFHQQDLAIARELGDRYGEGVALGNLGNAYALLEDWRKASECFAQYLVIARELDDRRGEGIVLGNLGSVYANLGDAQQAIVCYQQQLTIARELGDRRSEGGALGNLGSTYADLKEVEKAIEYSEQSLAIAHDLEDVVGAAMTSFNLAILLLQKGQLNKAKDYAEYAVQAFTQIGHSQYAAQAQQILDRIQAQ